MTTPATSMYLSTLRIQALDASSSVFGLGTGYLYNFPTPKGNIPVLITNKHVIEGASAIRLAVQVMPAGSTVKVDGSANGERTVIRDVSTLHGLVVQHPDDEIDLCAILLSDILRDLIAQGLIIKHQMLSASWRLKPFDIENATPAEPIAMVGYPDGLWDEVNNRPIIRQGTTASHMLAKWNGRREFMIDCACFGGSSGSPVFSFQNGMVRNEDGVAFGSRAVLIGTLWGGPTVSTEGELEFHPIPTSVKAVPVIKQMLNLGLVIHVSALDDLEAPVHQRIAELTKARSNISAALAVAKGAATNYPQWKPGSSAGNEAS